MQTVTLSTKYQLVIPRDIRKRLDLEPGARLTVVEVLPKATEDRIKVELLAPAPKELKEEGAAAAKESGKGGADAVELVQQNKVTNNIVWQLKLAPSEKRSLQFEYTVSWPTDKTLASYDYEG